MIMVVGGGIAGVACARELHRAGREVVLVDRGRRLGGRLAIRRYDGRPVDIGGSYFTLAHTDTAPGAAFEQTVLDWQRRGLAGPWTDTFSVWSPDGERESTGPVRWSAPGGLRGLVEDLAASEPSLRVESSVVVERIDRGAGGLKVDDRPVDTVVLAMPDPQARRLLGDGLAAERAQLSSEFDPVLALTAIWPERSWPDRSGVFVNDDPVIGWVADDGLRRGDRAPVLVAHSTSDFARAHLEHPDEAGPELLSGLQRVVDVGAAEPVSLSVHRWTFAKPSTGRDEPYLLSDSGLAACGDGWAAKSNVQAAFDSGWQLARAIVKQG